MKTPQPVLPYSQAIAATQQLSGRRSSSLKASYEAINLGVQANEFSIGRELAGAAQAAIASTSFETQVRQGPLITDGRNSNEMLILPMDLM